VSASVENVDFARAPAVAPVLIRQRDAGPTTALRAVALVLHGGRDVSVARVTARQLPVLRMVPIARHVARAGNSAGLGVWRLRFRYRGWNTAAHPVADVRWAVRRLREQHGDVPVVLIGHSMGGRAALRAADEPGVVAVVGLAPWVPPGEPHEQVVGRRLLVVHGTRDRTTSPKASKALVDAVRADGLAGLDSHDATPDDATRGTTEPTFVHLRHGGHSMLRRAALWDELTADFVLQAALGVSPGPRLAQAITAGESVL
jgi:pimeloyl-ACP methyl ester carboxylesterase